jgi:MFS family permease
VSSSTCNNCGNTTGTDACVGCDTCESGLSDLAVAAAAAAEPQPQPQPCVHFHEPMFTLDEGLHSVGFGTYQTKLLIVCGLGYAAGTVELILISFLLHTLNDTKQWGGLSSFQGSALASMAFAGSLLGSLFWGIVSDRVGRKPAFVLTVVISTCFGVLTAASVNVWMLIACRFMVGFALGGNLSVDMVMMLEFVPTHRRGGVLVALIMFGVGGVLFTAGVAWASIPTLGWRYFVMLCAIPSASVLLFRAYSHESPRYLVAQGKYDAAHEILQNVAEANGTFLPDGRLGERGFAHRNHHGDFGAGASYGATSTVTVASDSHSESRTLLQSVSDYGNTTAVTANTHHAIDANTDDSSSIASLSSSDDESEFFALGHDTARLSIHLKNFRDLITPPLQWDSICLWTIWFCLTFGYYGITIWLPRYLEAKHLGSSLYENFLLIGVAEIPGVIIVRYLVDCAGRRSTLVFAFIMCAVSTVLFGFATSHVSVIACSMAIYFFVVHAWAAIYVYTPEIYPTYLRTTASGFTSVFATLGGILSPIAGEAIMGGHFDTKNKDGVASVNQTHVWIVLSMYAGSFLLASIASCALRTETAGQQLLDTPAQLYKRTQHNTH